MSDLKKGIEGLDPNNDEHWTAAGLPRAEALAEANGGAKPSRNDMNRAAPGFDRTQAKERAEGGTGEKAAAKSEVNSAQTAPGSLGLTSGNQSTASRPTEENDEGEREPSPADIAGQAVEGDPALNNAGGLMERPMESTAERDDRASAQSARMAAALVAEGKVDSGDGDDPFAMLDEVVRISSSPRFMRNQTLAQIRTLWGMAGSGARQFQERIDKRNRRAQRNAKRGE